MNGKLLAERAGKLSDPSFFPVNFFGDAQNKTVKFQITGFENGLFQLEVHGVKFELMKDKDSPDADDSFDEEEKVVDMSLTGFI